QLQEMLGGMFPAKKKRRMVKVPEALELLTQEEAQKLIDMEAVVKEAVSKTEQHGIVFLDEIDKIAGRERSMGPDVSREGVQRDFTREGLEEIAATAVLVNERSENIGARRLFTIMERLLEEISFDAPTLAEKKLTIDAQYVKDRLKAIVMDEDLSRYIL